MHLALVLQCDPRGLIREVGSRQPLPGLVRHDHTVAQPGEAGGVQSQPVPGLGRRVGSRIDQSHGTASQDDAGATARPAEHLFESLRRPATGNDVAQGHEILEIQVGGQVEPGPRTARDRHPVDRLLFSRGNHQPVHVRASALGASGAREPREVNALLAPDRQSEQLRSGPGAGDAVGERELSRDDPGTQIDDLVAQDVEVSAQLDVSPATQPLPSETGRGARRKHWS